MDLSAAVKFALSDEALEIYKKEGKEGLEKAIKSLKVKKENLLISQLFLVFLAWVEKLRKIIVRSCRMVDNLTLWGTPILPPILIGLVVVAVLRSQG